MIIEILNLSLEKVEKRLRKEGTVSKSRKTRRGRVRKGSVHFHMGPSKAQGLEVFRGLFEVVGFCFITVLD